MLLVPNPPVTVMLLLVPDTPGQPVEVAFIVVLFADTPIAVQVRLLPQLLTDKTPGALLSQLTLWSVALFGLTVAVQVEFAFIAMLLGVQFTVIPVTGTIGVPRHIFAAWAVGVMPIARHAVIIVSITELNFFIRFPLLLY